MDDLRLGAAVRRLRLRQRLRQADLGARAGVSRTTIARIEHGRLDTLPLRTLRHVAEALEIRVDLVARWRGGELDRLLNAAHSALHDGAARDLAGRIGWLFRPEVTFAIYGERGVIDILAWHRGRDMLLVVELKTAIVDVNELLGTIDRKIRLARKVAAEHGWEVGGETRVSGWIIVSETRTNRRRVDAHRAVLRAAFPADGRTIDGWLDDPRQPIRCLSLWRRST